jgi:hypothetical protein
MYLYVPSILNINNSAFSHKVYLLVSYDSQSKQPIFP